MSQMNTEEKPTERFVLPEKLIQKIVIVAPDEKPLVVLYFLLELKYTRVLCFTKSIENTHRYFEIVLSRAISLIINMNKLYGFITLASNVPLI